MKKCPFCAEEIQDAAVVCRHCGKALPQPATSPNPSPAPAASKQNNWLLAQWVGLIVLAILAITWWYIILPLVIIGLLWVKTKYDVRKKSIASAVTIAVFALAFGVQAYYNRAPHITITDPKGEISVQAKDYMVKGSVSPAYASVTVNGNGIPVGSKGTFTTDMQLPNETNQLNLVVTNGGKQATATVVVKRIFTDAEKAAQAKATQEITAKAAAQRAQQESDQMVRPFHIFGGDKQGMTCQKTKLATIECSWYIKVIVPADITQGQLITLNDLLLQTDKAAEQNSPAPLSYLHIDYFDSDAIAASWTDADFNNDIKFAHDRGWYNYSAACKDTGTSCNTLLYNLNNDWVTAKHYSSDVL